jgi:hypothetical protein
MKIEQYYLPVARTPAHFREADVKRYLIAAKKAGTDVVRSRLLPDGSLLFDHQAEATSNPLSPYDEWKAKRDAR